jgi:hypothetical protein
VEKVSANQKRIWKEREETGEGQTIRAKIGNSISENNSQLTDEELREKYGWINKLTKEERQQWIDEVMMNTGLHAWWRDGDKDEQQKAVERRNATKLGVTVEEYRNYNFIDEPKERYYKQVWLITERNYQEYKDEIDPQNLRSPKYHLDHKFSVIRGYYEQVPPEIIGSKHNLEILPSSENSRKSGKCSINIEQLTECYNGEVRSG